MSGFVAGLVLGGLTGLALGMLLAPRSGAENRERVLEQLPELGTRAPDLISRLIQELRARLEEGWLAFRQGRDDARARLEQELAQARGSDSPTRGS